jgi:hypothetical protein
VKSGMLRVWCSLEKAKEEPRNEVRLDKPAGAVATHALLFHTVKPSVLGTL